MSRRRNAHGRSRLYRTKIPIYNNERENVADTFKEEQREEDEILMTQLIEKIDNLQIPPHIMRELGLEKNWQKKISPEFKRRVVNTALKHKELLRELSKY